MLGPETYREWASAFGVGASYRGDWETGSKIVFAGPDPENKNLETGMVARIKENRLHEFVSIEHYGYIRDGVEDTTSEEVKSWLPAYENYTFVEKDGGTELTVDLDSADQFKDMFEEMWPKALELLRQVAER